MKTARTLTAMFALSLGSLAAVGCAADAPDSGTEPEGGPTGPGPRGDDPVDATGQYSMRSNFDIATNMPGKVGDAVNAFINATDGGNDPSEWLIDLMISKVGNSIVRGALNLMKPVLVQVMQQELNDIAPDLLMDLKTIGNDFRQMAQNLGTNEVLEISGSPGSYVAKHSVLGLHFKVDDQESDMAFAEFGVESIVVDSVKVELDAGGKLAIGTHVVPMGYGKLLRVGLDGRILPMIEPGVKNLGEFLAKKVNCARVGNLLSDAIDIPFTSGVIESGCKAGLTVGAGFIYQKIADIDGNALEFGLTGTARALDKNDDGAVDYLEGGAWTGELKYAGVAAPLGTATFKAERMGAGSQ